MATPDRTLLTEADLVTPSPLKDALDGKADLSHAARHAAGGPDPITPESIGALGSVPVTIPPTADLNTITVPGTYHCGSSNGPTVALNYPVNGFAGLVQVTARATMLVQVATYFLSGSALAGRWYRTRYVEAWSPWKQMDTSSVTPASIGALDLIAKILPISPVVDLNTLTVSGWYCKNSSTGSTAAANYPTDGWAGFIEVITYSSSHTMQRATALVSSLSSGASTEGGIVYERSKYGSAWGPWTVVSGPLRSTGSPLGVVAAPVGTEYIDVNATNGARKWYKATGTGNTGWIVTEGDTGWRQTTAFLSAGFATDNARLRRVGQTVSVHLQGTTVADSHSYVPAGMPLGFRPSTTGVVFPVYQYSPTSTPRNLGHFGLNAAGTTFFRTAAAGVLFFECSYLANDPWPTTLPGTPT